MPHKYFVSPEFLYPRLHKDKDSLRILDASWSPQMPGQAYAYYQAGHIPGALFFDLEAFSDAQAYLPCMLPNVEDFSSTLSKMGVSETMEIILYDQKGLFSAARVWWMLRAFGAENVKILAGGWPAWKEKAYPVESQEVKYPPVLFKGTFNAHLVAHIQQVEAAVTQGSPQILDARSKERFEGKTPEPRPDMRAGHIPGSYNLPYHEIIKGGTLVSVPNLEKAFRSAGIDLSKPVITTCGAGITAAILSLALAEMNVESALYDGSWAEWGKRQDLPHEYNL